MESKATENNIILVTEWNDHHTWPPLGGLRHLINYEKTNGFHYCVIRAAGRVFIDEKRFFEWLGNNGKAPKAKKEQTKTRTKQQQPHFARNNNRQKEAATTRATS